MPETIEQALARTLAAAITIAPQPDETFAAAVATRRRRRQRWTAAIAAAMALVFSTPVVAALVSPAGPVDRDQPPPVTPQPPIDLTAARPVAEVWPSAVVRLPAVLPDGRQYNVLVRLDDGRYVVVAPTTNAFNDRAPVLLDPTTGEVTQLTPGGEGDVQGDSVTIGERRVLWVVYRRPATTGAEIWSLPRTGGTASRLASIDFTEPERWAGLTPFEVGDQVYLSAAVTPSRWTSTMRTYAVADGQLRRMPDADGWQLAGAGWLMLRPNFPLVPATPSAVPRRNTTPPVPSASAMPEVPSPTPPPAPPTWWNVATGQRLTPNLPHGLDCLGLWCHTRGDDHIEFYRFDASTAVSARGSRLVPESILDGYFTVVRSADPDGLVAYLWDLRRNVAARLGATGVFPRYRHTALAVVIEQSSHKVIVDFTLIDR